MPPDITPSDHEREKIERLRRAMYSRDLSDKLGARERHDLDEEEAAPHADWQASQEPEEQLVGVTVAPRFIGATRLALRGLLFVALGFCVIALGFFAYFFTLGGGSLSTSSRNIEIVVNGPPEVPSGTPVELQIAITNKNTVPLELAEIVITYPDGTHSSEQMQSQQ